MRRIRQVKESGLVAAAAEDSNSNLNSHDVSASTSASTNSGSISRTQPKWLDHEHLLERKDSQETTNWKRQYRLRHNWSKGSCNVSELEVAQPPIPPVLVKLCEGVVFTTDSRHGLRAWTTRNTKTCLASQTLSVVDGEDNLRRVPTAMVVTRDNEFFNGGFRIILGFEAGNFANFSFELESRQFYLQLSHTITSAGPITALAASSPYILALSQNQTLFLYRSSAVYNTERQRSVLEPPRLITSLKASNILAPLSLSIRTLPSDIIATIAYSFSWIGCGWSVGLQELRLGQEGENLGSRLATTVDSQFVEGPLSASKGINRRQQSTNTNTNTNTNSRDQKVVSSSLTPALLYTQPPTSLSYSHPYLLASHADNTLTMYLVESTADSLTIKAGRRLWGHTSSVSGVQVSDRGKAVSVSSRGDEIRIWELEDAIPSRPTSRRELQRERSVQISPGNLGQQREQREQRRRRRSSSSLDLGLVSAGAIGGRKGRWGLEVELLEEKSRRELNRVRGWIGFDDEQVVVLREQEVGTQLLDCYDFT